MSSLVQKLFSHRFFPDDCSIPAIHGHDHELVAMCYGHFVMPARCAAVFRRQGVSTRHSRRDEDTVSPDRWSRMPSAGQFNLPSKVFTFTPLNRRLGMG